MAVTGIRFTEQASDPGSTGAGQGTVWVKNDAPTVLYFTDDAGTDHEVGYAATAIPTGGIIPYAPDEDTAPSGWLICDGQAVSRTTYSALFTAIGTLYGVGNGSTTFNVPDLRARSIMGANHGDLPNGADGGKTTRQVADDVGAETHTLTTGEMPSHSHGVTDSGHSHGVTDPGHLHSINISATGTGAGRIEEGPFVSGTQNTNTNTTGLTVNSATTGISTNSAGSGNAHANIPPTVAMNWIIKT